MEQYNLVVGFSDLKELLIRTYAIERDRALVKLYFSESALELVLHDYDDHFKTIVLCFDMPKKRLRRGLSYHSQKLVRKSLNYRKPSDFLNNEFRLNGFFRF